MTPRFWRLFTHAVICALVLDTVLGIIYASMKHMPAWHGIYDTYMTSVTEGPDAPPIGLGQHLVIAASAAFPLFAFSAAWAFAINALNGKRLEQTEHRLMAHLEDRLARHKKEETEREHNETEPA